MAIDAFEVAKVGAGFVLSYVSDQNQAGKLAADVAELLNEYNEKILVSVSILETRPDESSHIWGVRVRQLEPKKQPTHQG